MTAVFLDKKTKNKEGGEKKSLPAVTSNPSRQNKGAKEFSNVTGSVPLLLLHSPHELKEKERGGKNIPHDLAERSGAEN